MGANSGVRCSSSVTARAGASSIRRSTRSIHERDDPLVSHMTRMTEMARATIPVMAKARPRGRAEFVDALMHSARKLIAERGPAVALRDIADDAGVNFGLIYQYLGTKEQLVAEVYAHATEAAATRLSEAEHIDEALSLLMSLGDGTTARLIGWAALDNSQSAASFRDSPALRVLADFVIADAQANGVDVSAEDARMFAAFAMMISLGRRLFA